MELARFTPFIDQFVIEERADDITPAAAHRQEPASMPILILLGRDFFVDAATVGAVKAIAILDGLFPSRQGVTPLQVIQVR